MKRRLLVMVGLVALWWGFFSSVFIMKISSTSDPRKDDRIFVADLMAGDIRGYRYSAALFVGGAALLFALSPSRKPGSKAAALPADPAGVQHPSADPTRIGHATGDSPGRPGPANRWGFVVWCSKFLTCLTLGTAALVNIAWNVLMLLLVGSVAMVIDLSSQSSIDRFMGLAKGEFWLRSRGIFHGSICASVLYVLVRWCGFLKIPQVKAGRQVER